MQCPEKQLFISILHSHITELLQSQKCFRRCTQRTKIHLHLSGLDKSLTLGQLYHKHMQSSIHRLYGCHMWWFDIPVLGKTLLTKTKMPFSGCNLIRLRITYTNCPTVRSHGTRYFFLSMSGMSLCAAFSQITGMRSGYLSRMRCASVWRFSKQKNGDSGWEKSIMLAMEMETWWDWARRLRWGWRE